MIPRGAFPATSAINRLSSPNSKITTASLTCSKPNASPSSTAARPMAAVNHNATLMPTILWVLTLNHEQTGCQEFPGDFLY